MAHPLKIFLSFLFLSSFIFLLSTSSVAQPTKIIPLWPNTVPSESCPKSPVVINPDNGGNVTRVAAVTDPVLEVFEPYGSSALVMAGALRDAKVPVELHFLPKGGHGYGVRPGNPAAETWPDLAAKWLNQFITGRIQPPGP